MRVNWTGEEKDVKGGPITEAFREDLQDVISDNENRRGVDPEMNSEIKKADIHGLRALANQLWGYGDQELGDYLANLIADIEGDETEPPQRGKRCEGCGGEKTGTDLDFCDDCVAEMKRMGDWKDG